jgi:hypothetical protein
MQLEITALYAALSGLLLIMLSAAVSKKRLGAHISLGDGNDAALNQAIRAHGNFVEYVPLALILLALVETYGTSHIVVHILGASLIIGRLLHAWGMNQAQALGSGRKLGTILTWGMILVTSLLLLYKVLF